MGPALYDHQGNLWMAISRGWNGWGIVVYANKTGTGRKISTSGCGFNPATPFAGRR